MYAVSFIAMAISGLTVAAGFYIYLKKDKANAKRIRKLVRASVSIYVVLVAVFLFFLIPGIASAESSANSSSGMGFLAAALSTGISRYCRRLCSGCRRLLGYRGYFRGPEYCG